MITNTNINRFLEACVGYLERFDDWEHFGCCLVWLFLMGVTTLLVSSSIVALTRTLLKVLGN